MCNSKTKKTLKAIFARHNNVCVLHSINCYYGNNTKYNKMSITMITRMQMPLCTSHIFISIRMSELAMRDSCTVHRQREREKVLTNLLLVGCRLLLPLLFGPIRESVVGRRVLDTPLPCQRRLLHFSLLLGFHQVDWRENRIPPTGFYSKYIQVCL